MTAAVDREIRHGVVLPRVTATPSAEVFSPSTAPAALERVTTRSPVRAASADPVPARPDPRRPRARVVALTAVAVAVLAALPLLVIFTRGSSGRDAAAPAADRATGQSGRNPGAPAPNWPSAAPSVSPSTGTPSAEPSAKGSPGADASHRPKAGAGRSARHAPEGGSKGGHVGVATTSTRSIVSAASGRCISVSAHTAKDGSALQIYDCQGARWQKWTFEPDGSVRSMGMCMDVAWGSSDNGTTIQLARCHGGPAQTFDLNGAGDLVNTGADKCVDVTDKKTANGTRLQLWQCAGTSNQKWSAV
jgi:hypothetical protein